MKHRKLISSLLALALTLALAVPAFATDTTLDGTNTSSTITVTTELNVPTISVTIAPVSGMVINPYKLSYSGTVSGSDSLISAPALITNNSLMKVKLTAKPFVSDAKEVTIVGTKGAAEGTTEKAAAFVEFMFATGMNASAPNDPAQATFGADGSGLALKTGNAESVTTPAEVTLEKADDETHPTYSAYKLQGATGGTGWTSENKFTIQIVFDIAPVIGG